MTPAQQKQPKLHAVSIHVNDKGFVYRTPEEKDAAIIRVRHGDHVKWNCDHGNYTVLFKGESPFEQVALHGRRNMESAILAVVGKPGSYKYAVTVALPDGGLIVDDPEVIIDGD